MAVPTKHLEELYKQTLVIGTILLALQPRPMVREPSSPRPLRTDTLLTIPLPACSPGGTGWGRAGGGGAHLGEQDAQQEARHDGIVVHEPDEHGVGAAPHVDDVLHAEPLLGEEEPG